MLISSSSASMRRRMYSTDAGSAFWLNATFAHAVSKTLTALSGKLPRRNVAARKFDGRFERFVEYQRVVMIFQNGHKRAQHFHAFFVVGLVNFQILKSSRKGGIFFKILDVFRMGRCPQCSKAVPAPAQALTDLPRHFVRQRRPLRLRCAPRR